MENSDPKIESNESEQLNTSPVPDVLQSPDVTEEEHQLANKATLAYFNRKNFTEALTHLESLHVTRPNDVRVSGNLVLVRHLVNGGGFSELGQLQKDLQTTLTSSLSASDDDTIESELHVLIFNLAICAFYQKHFLIAEQLLQQVYSSLPSQSAPIGNSPCSQKFKFHHLLPLMISVALSLNKPHEALNYLSEAESLAIEFDVDGSFGPKSILLRAQALIQSRQHKVFKRDLKPIGLNPEQLIIYEFYRSNLEFFKGNHRKATKLLSLVVQQHQGEVSSLVHSFYQNNLGCLHLMLGKPNIGLFYFNNSLLSHSEYFTNCRKEKPLRKDAALLMKQSELFFNMGLAFLQAGQSEKAFQSFTSCLPVLYNRASLWLHLAECCIQAHKESHPHIVSSFCSTSEDQSMAPDSILSTVGSGVYRKFVVKSPERKKSSALSPQMSMEYAAKCLRNALHLCGFPEIGGNPSSPKGNGNASSTNSSSQTSPVKSPSSVPKLFTLRAAILVNSAYVALCLSDPIEALTFAQRLRDFNRNGILPNGYVILGQLYAAEALIQLNRTSEIRNYLNPSYLVGMSFNDVDATDESNGGSKKSDPKLAAARVLFQFNMAVALVLRGELEKAESLIEELHTDDIVKTEFHLHIVVLRLYIQLAKGNFENCRNLASKFCGLRHI